MLKKICLTAVLAGLPVFAQNEKSNGPVLKEPPKAELECVLKNRIGLQVGRFVYQEAPGKSFLEDRKKMRTDLEKVESKYETEDTRKVVIEAKGKDSYIVDVRKVAKSYPPVMLNGRLSEPTDKDVGRAFKGKLVGKGCEPLMKDRAQLEAGIRKLLAESGKI